MNLISKDGIKVIKKIFFKRISLLHFLLIQETGYLYQLCTYSLRRPVIWKEVLGWGKRKNSPDYSLYAIAKLTLTTKSWDIGGDYHGTC